MRQGTAPSAIVIALNASTQLPRFIDESVVAVPCVVVVAVDVIMVDVVDVTISWTIGNESNASIQLDTSIVRGVGAGEFDGCVLTMLEVEVSLLPVGAIDPFCDGMDVPFGAIDTFCDGMDVLFGAIDPFCDGMDVLFD